MKKGTFIAIVITLIILILGVSAVGVAMLQKQNTSTGRNSDEDDEGREVSTDREETDNANSGENNSGEVKSGNVANATEENATEENASESKFTVSNDKQTAEEEQATEEKKSDRYELYKRRSYYAEVISKFANTNLLPEETESSLEASNARDEGNKFAVYDVDGDGIEELLITITSTSMASMRELIFEYDVNNDSLKRELLTFPSVTYYSNGVARVEASHNQGLGMSLWPYSVYTINKESQVYDYTGSVDSWEKAYMDTDYNGEPFPDDLDKDGDGILYYISENGAETRTSTKAELDEWEKNVFGTAHALHIPWIDIMDSTATEMQYQKDYQVYLCERREASVGKNGTDIGKLYVDNMDVADVLKGKYGFEMIDEDEYFTTGNYNGKQVVNFYWESGGSMEYTNERVGDITLFELYPGISRTEAEAILNEYGFKTKASEGYYSTGDSFGNWSVFLQFDNGTVTSISLYASTAYAG